MRELLQQALDALKTRWNGGRVDIDGDFHSKQTFDEAAMQSAQEAIEAALSRSKWNKVADGLPVVPEGKEYVDVWAVVDGKVQEDAYGPQIVEDKFGDLVPGENGFCSCQVTHWMYLDTPAPPEDL